MGQSQPAPSVEWSQVDWGGSATTAGTYYEWNGSTTNPAFVPDLTPPTGGQTRAQSGEEWWFGHTNVYVGGDHVGYAVAGYGSWANNILTEVGCGPAYIPEPAPNELESWERGIKGTTRGMVGFYDLNGEMVWCKSLLTGLLYNVIQTSDEKLSVVGSCDSPGKPADMLDPVPLMYNGDAAVDFSAPGACAQYVGNFSRKGFIAQLDVNGTLEWMSTYSTPALAADGWSAYSVLEDVAEVTINGVANLVAVGTANASGTYGVQEGYITRCGLGGARIEDHSYPFSDPVWGALDPGNVMIPPIDPESRRVGWFSAIAASPADGSFAVVGYYRRYEQYGADGRNHITLLQFQPDTDPLTDVAWGNFSGNGGDAVCSQGGLVQTMRHYTTGVDYTLDGSKVIWPTLANMPEGPLYDGNDIYQGAVANLRVQAFDAATGAYAWTSDAGEVRAYDLQSDLCATSDGNVAVVCTKWAPGYSPTDLFDWDDLPTSTQQCLLDDFNNVPGVGNPNWDFTPPIPPNANPRKLWNYWNTDAFVAKIDATDGTMLWCTQWDADPDSEFDCAPGDMRNQECMYKITEAEDGGLVVSGNTSHNFDDYYLAKLGSDCQSPAAYDPVVMDGLDNNHVYTLSANEVWNTPKIIHGVIRIPAGYTLTIDGATIQFADSKQQEYPTRIDVEPGGKLLVNSDAVLTSIAECPGSVWDGILVKGTNNSQDGNSFADQGYAYVRGATIENARTAMITNNQFLDGDDLAAYQLQFAGGGVIRTRGATFRNNKRDVVMGPYENHAPNDPTEVRVNRSYFHDTRFIVGGPLADAHRPLEHISLYGVRNIPVLGCAFSGTYFQPDPDNSPLTVDAGKGIRALQSSFIVAPFCPVIVNVGEPCPTPVMPTFDRLLLAVEVADFTDDKTFSVDQATFTRCPRNIRMDGVRNPAITSNHFEVVDFRDPFLYSTPYGIYSDECTGYEIEDNELLGDLTTSRAQAGIVIKNSGREANRIYNNKLDAFGYKNSTALLIQGENADPEDDYLIGLDIKCNDFGQSGSKNAYDVALTAGDPTVRGTQGALSSPTDYPAPAGNRFSILGADESDWHVANTSNFVVYYHHQGSAEAWVPQDFDAVYLDPDPSFVNPPTNWNEACPSNQRSRERERSGLVAGSEEKSEELEESKATYDATLDNGDTYSLLGYVSDPAASSLQVRNALQSVAPNVGVEVWKAAFERSPALNAWNLTQALLSNSPLQPEAMKLCYESDLSDFYYNLVASAQSGINPLDILESDISTNSSGKAEDLTDLGRWSWLDSTNVDSMFTLLKLWHDQLPADNGDAVLAGYYVAKGDNIALHDLASALELSSDAPAVYGVLKLYAIAEQADGWTRPDAATSTYLTDLAQDRWTRGSTRAGAWLQAFSGEPLEEVVILPIEERAMETRKRVRNSSSQEAIILEAYPNPTDGVAFVVCNVPEGVEQAQVRVHDLNGRLIGEQRITAGSAIVEMDLSTAPAGVYAAALTLDGVRSGTVKLTVR